MQWLVTKCAIKSSNVWVDCHSTTFIWYFHLLACIKVIFMIAELLMFYVIRILLHKRPLTILINTNGSKKHHRIKITMIWINFENVHKKALFLTSIIIWLVTHYNSSIRLHILACDIFQPATFFSLLLSSKIRIRTNFVYLSDDATDSSGKEFWATQPVEAMSG